MGDYSRNEIYELTLDTGTKIHCRQNIKVNLIYVNSFITFMSNKQLVIE